MIYWIGIVLLSLVAVVILAVFLLLFAYMKTTVQVRAIMDTLNSYLDIDLLIKKRQDYVKKNKKEKDL